VITQHNIRKRFGQNFLVDNNIINKILDLIEPRKHDHFIEIGPGMGALTFPILDQINNLDVIEIDRDLVNKLREHNHTNQLSIHSADALKFDFNSLCHPGQKLRLMGNLPYNISTPLLFHILSYSNIFHDLHIMVQKEVGDRICSMPNNKTYGRLSVAMQARCKTTKLFDIKPNAFYPRPKVNSSMVQLIPYQPMSQQQEQQLDRVVQLAFSKRRKKIKNALDGLFKTEDLKLLAIDPEKRPENLSVKDYINLSKIL